MDAGHADQVGAVLLIEIVHVGDVLEVVGIQFALFHGVVGDHIVVEFLDDQGVALFGHQFLGDLQNFTVGRGGGADGDGLSFGLFAAGGQGQQQADCQQQNSNSLFHDDFLLFSLV